MSETKKVPKIIGYSLGVCVAVAILLTFFWVLITAYDITIIIDSETHVAFQSFFNILYTISLIILGFTIFPPALYFVLEIIYSFRNKRKKTGILHMIAKNTRKIVYSGTIGYWLLYLLGLFLFIIFYITKQL